MRSVKGTTDIATAGTAVQIKNVKDRVLAITYKNPSRNTGILYLGNVSMPGYTDVESAAVAGTINGFSLDVGETFTESFSDAGQDGSVVFDTLYVDAATDGDDLDWSVILR
jgi:hypothetical protein|tara:strand:- start:33 stop:365 length:333 start_codon:yes stop_codon:yes gene_type:complete